MLNTRVLGVWRYLQYMKDRIFFFFLGGGCSAIWDRIRGTFVCARKYVVLYTIHTSYLRATYSMQEAKKAGLCHDESVSGGIWM